MTTRLPDRLSSILSSMEFASTNTVITAGGRNAVHERLQALLQSGQMLQEIQQDARDLIDWLDNEDVLSNHVRSKLVATSQASEIRKWHRTVQFAIAMLDGNIIEKLCNGGMDMNFISENEHVKFTSFELAGAAYDNNPCDQSLRVLEILALHSNKTKTLAALQRLLGQCDLSADNLKKLCMAIVQGSKYPITTSLQVSALVLRAADKVMTKRDSYNVVGNFFTRFALHLLHDLNSDHVSAIAIETEDESGVSAIDVSLKTRNLEFISDWQVARIMTTIWSTADYMNSNSFVDYGLERRGKSATELLVRSPRKFFLSNRGKFYIWACGFLLFLVLFTWLGIRVGKGKVRVDSDISVLELVVWWFGLGYIAAELVELYKQGPTQYWSSGWNLLDSTFAMSFSAFVFTRWISMPLSAKQVEDGSHQQVFEMIMALNAVVLWARLTYLFIVNETLGPFIRMIACFMRDVYVFLYLMAVLMFGFGLGLNIVVGTQIEAHRTLLGSIFTLYQAGLGEFDFEPYQELPTALERLTAQTLLAVYLACAAIVLVNLLIAMLAETFSSIHQDQHMEFMFGRASLATDLNRGNNVLPPPFNSVVYTVFCFEVVALRIITWGRSFICRKKAAGGQSSLHSQDNSASSVEVVVVDASIAEPKKTDALSCEVCEKWLCARCHHRNPEKTRDQTIAEVCKLMERVQGHVPASLKNVQVNRVELCENCFRLKKKMAPKELLRERISFGLFIVFFFIPGVLLFFIPTFIRAASKRLKCSSMLTGLRVWTRQLLFGKKAEIAKHSYTPVLCVADDNMRSWVEQNVIQFHQEQEA